MQLLIIQNLINLDDLINYYHYIINNTYKIKWFIIKKLINLDCLTYYYNYTINNNYKFYNWTFIYFY